MMSRFSSPFSSLCALCLVGVFLSGCAAYSAFNLGLPDLKVIQVGASRTQVEAELGKPVSRNLVQDGTTADVYEYTSNRDPNVIRGIFSGIASVLSLGLFETVAMERGRELRDTFHVHIVYDGNGKVVEGRTIKAPSAAR